MDLRLDDPDRPAEPARHLDRLGGGIGHSAARHRDAEFRQQLFRLVFVDVHRISPEIFMLLDDVDQLADRGDRFVEGRLLLAIELDLDDALDAAGADHDRHADIEVLDPVLAVEPRGAGQHALLVAQIGLGHRIAELAGA